MKILLPCISILCFVASCTFRQDVNFNKNWSGDMTCTIDMSEMATLLESTGDPMDLMADDASKSKISRLKSIPGIKKVKVKETGKGIYRITYGFKDLAALNKSGSVLFADEKEPLDFSYFDLRDSQTLFFSFPFKGTEETAEADDADNSIGENFIYELKLNFPWKIESIETKTNAAVSTDRKQLFFRSDIFTLTSPEFDPGILIRFRK